MIEVEVFGAESLPYGPSAAEVCGLCQLAASALGARDGHLAVEFIDARRMAELNARHRGKPEPTDVLSFPVDGLHAPANGGAAAGGAHASAAPVPDEPGSGEFVRSEAGSGETVPRELGDVLICPEHTTDVREAVVHGVLHLVGMDHEVDDGEMLELQAELLARRKP